MLKFLPALALIAMMLLTGCPAETTSPSDDADNTFRVDGSGYSNVLVTTTSEGRVAIESDDIGSVLLIGTVGDESFSTTLTVEDVRTGTIQINQSQGVGLSVGIVKDGVSKFFFATSGTITMTTWGGVGGAADGSFTASAIQTPGSQQVSISGKFKISPIISE